MEFYKASIVTNGKRRIDRISFSILFIYGGLLGQKASEEILRCRSNGE